jgi:rubrerythrin
MFVLLMINKVRRKVAIQRTDESLIRAMYEWFTLFGDANKLDRTVRFWHPPIKFYCMICGKEHKKTACPQCGSKTVRMG